MSVKKPIDKSKKSNRRCVNCEHWKDRTIIHDFRSKFTANCDTIGCSINYWNCCAYFEWAKDKEYIN